jgi:potassium/sodium efflux P-type ATPase
LDGILLSDVASLRPKEVFGSLETSPQGLNTPEAAKRLAKHGLNMLVEKKRTSVAFKFVLQLKDLFSLLLLFASILATFVDWGLGIIILGVVLVNTIFSLFQEWRAERAMEALRSWMPEYAKVFRDGELRKISVKELVPGDVIVLEEGDRVPADGRLVETFDLWTNNVPLTGESEPQARTDKAVKITDSPYLDVPNLVFMSTSVAKGRGKAVVFATGMNTKFGQIAGLTQRIAEEPSPLQKEIAYTAKYDFAIALAVGVVFFLASQIWLHLGLYVGILFMIGVMVACVPEGLQVTVSSALAINVLKMVKQNVLVKRLSAAQTLGSVTVICTDKTGTITTGEMTVENIWVPGRGTVEVSGVGYTPIGELTQDGKILEKDGAESVEKLLEISALCNNAKVEPPSDKNHSWSVIGDPTDGALLVSALKFDVNVHRIAAEKPMANVLPFDSKRKRMTTIHKTDHKILIYTKGGPRSILSVCNRLLLDGSVKELTGECLSSIEAEIRDFADQGLRVIAVAFREISDPQSFKPRDIEQEMIFVGLAGMRDSPRPEVKEAVKLAREAGIGIVIITGDYGPTAEAIAEDVGIVEAEKSRIIRGVDLEAMPDGRIIEEVARGDVIFARVSPEQKLRIVTVLKHSGQVVAVTGDGANDAPSLKEADIGIAMGVSGTDVAREAADMVLLDDSFASIVGAVESGRAIYENIRKFIIYVFSHNWAELIPFVLYAVLGIPLPLLVVQILAIDLAIDVIPSLALSREPPEPGIMQEPPRSVTEKLFNTNVFLRSLFVGVIIAAGALYGCFSAWASGGWYLGSPNPLPTEVYVKGTTMTFAGIVIAQVGNVLASRTSKVSIFRTNVSSNRWIWFGIAAQVSMLSFLIYVPLMQGFFGTTAIGLMEWAYLILLAVIVVLAEEVRKWFARRR